MKHLFLFIFTILLNLQGLAQVTSKDSLWIDSSFDSVDLVVIPQYEFVIANLTLEPLGGKKVYLPKDYWRTDWSEHPLSKEVPMNVLQGGGLSLGLMSKNIDFFVSYFTGWNQFSDYSYDTPYNSANNTKIGDVQISLEKIGTNAHYWFTNNNGVGLEYEMFSSNIKIVKVLDKIGGLTSTPIANFYILHHSLYLYTPIKFNIDKFNINLLAGFTLFSIGKGSTSIHDINDINFSEDLDTPFGLKLNLGINTMLFNYLPFGIKYKFHYLFSKSEYSYITNTISFQIGIPKL